MDPVVPQDEYFEWEDIIAYQTVREDRDENSMLQSESLSCTWKIESVGVSQLPDIQQSDNAKPSMAPSTASHSLRASLTLDTSSLGINSTDSTPTRSSPIVFPSYAEFGDDGSSFLIENFASDPENFEIARETMDDISLCPVPSRHVDYLSHDWDEEDIWATWKRLQSKRQAPNVAERLENATWRAWAKVRLNLKTVSPESFNWMKDLDDTWLYGPFHGNISRTTTFTTNFSNDTHSSHTTLTVKKTRSILKRPRLSEVLLRGSEHLGKFRSKSVELDSRPYYGDTTKKRVVFREEVEQYAAAQTSHVDEDDKDELDYWTETYSSNYSYDDPVEDLLSKTQSLRHHVEQNIKILENYRTPPPLPPRKVLEKLPPAPLKRPKDNPSEESPQSGKVTSSPTRHHNEPLRFSTLSEWTLLGGDSFFDEEEDWLEPATAPYTNWKPTIPDSADITSETPSRPARPNIEVNLEEEMRDELTALMRCEELYLEPSSSSFSEPSSASDTNSSGSSDDPTERDDLNHVIVRDLEEDESRKGGIKGLMEMKQAFVDRVMEDFYLTEKEENLHSLVPPDLMLAGVKTAV
ncbi:hypothetical protein N431DRAFT_440949 [Stipitochalara longipes BDJ]|nr:hypothetical protein N431DRAFT_440949 [Stipitochalara longipes BDJ]